MRPAYIAFQNLSAGICAILIKPQDYVNAAKKDSKFLSTLYVNEIETGLYNFAHYIGTALRNKYVITFLKNQNQTLWQLLDFVEKWYFAQFYYLAFP